MGEVLHINLDDDDEKKPSRHRSKKTEVKEETEEEKKNKGRIESKKDLEDLFRTLTDELNDYINIIDSFTDGVNYLEAWGALDAFVVFLTNGPHIAVYKEYSYLADPAKQAAFLKSESSQLDFGTRASLAHFVMMMRRSEESRNDVKRLVDEKMKPGRVEHAYKTIRLNHQIRSIYSYKNRDFLFEVFMRFSYLYDMFNGRKYSSLDIDEMTVGEDEAYEQVLKVMNAFIKNSPSLRDAMNFSATGMAVDILNYVRLYDKLTKEMGECLVSKDPFKDTISECEKVERVFNDMAKEGYDSDIQWSRYCYQISRVVQSMRGLFDVAWRILDDFQNKTGEAPFNIIHPGTEMDNAARNSGLGYISQGIYIGTRYADAMSKMPAVATRIARQIAKTAAE